MGRKRIGELLLEQGIIDDRQLQGALQYQRDHGGRLGNALVQKGFLSEEQLVTILGQVLNIPVVDIPERTDPAALRLLKAQFCEEHDIFPLHLEDARSTGRRTLTLALSDPLDIPTLEEVEFVTGCRIQPAITTSSQIHVAILRHYHRQNVDQRRAADRMTVVRPGGDEEEIDMGRGAPPKAARPPPVPGRLPTLPQRKPAPASPPPPRFGEEEEVMFLTEEVTSRTELAELIREKEKHTASDPNLRFLTGQTDAERLETLERKFWALMRILAKKGQITKDEFLAEFDK